MGWVPERRKLGGGLALAALALQLALSFGHIHTENVAAAAPGPATAQPAAIGGSGGGEHHQDGGHDACAICATVHLAGTLLLPAPPSVLLPIPKAFAWLPAAGHHDVACAARQPFQARAPPLA